MQQLLTNKQLTYCQKDSILRQILEGIAFLHSQGIIHRDLKPQNILIANRNGEYIPKITDFGISKKLDVNNSSVFTNSLAGAGTLSFASPEQLLGKTIRKNTDLWSFGVIACWIFTGKLPFNTGDQTVTSEAGRIELFKQITSGDITSILQTLPTEWRELVKQCIVVDNMKRISYAEKCLQILDGKIVNFEEKVRKIEEKTEDEPKTVFIERKTINEEYELDEQQSLFKRSFKGIIIGFILIGLLFWLGGNFNRPKPIELAPKIDSTVVQVDTTQNTTSNEYYQVDTSRVQTAISRIESQQNSGTVEDIDGNVYKTVKIGNQIWMAENLKVTHFQNGDEIPYISDNVIWSNLSSGACCTYENNSTYNTIYGKLYNWYAVDDNRALAPKGWHIPSNQEWIILTNYLGGKSIAGGKLKEKGTKHWLYPNQGATNVSEFSALPGGYRNHVDDGAVYGLSYGGYWWATTAYGVIAAMADISYEKDNVYLGRDSKTMGYSVRCIKDN